MNKKTLDILSECDGAIFDMDGTIIDSMRIWSDIDKRFFAAHDMDIPKGLQQKIAHMNFKEMAQYFKDTFSFSESVEEINQMWMNMAKEEYSYNIKLKPYVKEFLASLKERNYKISLATSNQKDLYEPCLKNNKILEYFDYLLNTNVYSTSKDEPTIYLEASKKMNTPVEKTVVFEDIYPAIKTAKNAGFKVIAIYDDSSKDREKDIRYLADDYIYSFDVFK